MPQATRIDHATSKQHLMPSASVGQVVGLDALARRGHRHHNTMTAVGGKGRRLTQVLAVSAKELLRYVERQEMRLARALLRALRVFAPSAPSACPVRRVPRAAWPVWGWLAGCVGQQAGTQVRVR